MLLISRWQWGIRVEVTKIKIIVIVAEYFKIIMIEITLHMVFYALSPLHHSRLNSMTNLCYNSSDKSKE